MLHLYDTVALDEPDARTHAIIAHMLRWVRGYNTPEAWADGLLLRLDLEGYRIVRKEPHA